jgi:hypothetical protein
MNKRQKRSKKNGYKHKNSRTRTKRQYGGRQYGGNDVNENESGIKNEERKGIIDNIGNKASDIASNAAGYLSNKGLRLFGLEKSGDHSESVSNINIGENLNNKIEEITNVASGVISDVSKIANKGSAVLLENVNDVLGSSKVNETVSEAASETAEIGKKLFENINEKFDNPEFKEDAKEALENTAQYSEIALKAMDKPINEAVDKLNEAGTKAFAGVASGSVKVLTDTMAAVPGVGAVVEMGKIINDASKAASAVVEAGSEAVETVSDFYIDTKKNMEEQMEQLEEKKSEALNISKRTGNSISEFQDPLKLNDGINSSDLKKGGKKTRKGFLKQKSKTKRVRFAI